MRFLLLNQFYPPDPAPTGKYMHDLARTLVSHGHAVKVLCSRRSYDGGSKFASRELLDGVNVVRVSATGFGRRSFVGKLADYATFYCSLFLQLLSRRMRPDLILSLTTPPYIGLLGKLAAKWHRCSHAHWIMDLYPDVMFAHGMAKPEGFLPSLLQNLARFQFFGAQAVIALGPVMGEKLSAYIDPAPEGTRSVDASATLRAPTSELRPPTSVHCLPLWSDPGLSPLPPGEPNLLRQQRGWNGELVLLYSGNMGLGHRLNEFLQTAKQLGPAGPRWAFSGGGKRRGEIEAFAAANPQARIELLDYVHENSLRDHLCSADVHLASLDSAWQGLMVPSKLQASFAVGKPVLFVGDSNNETARWIQEADAGWVVAENDQAGLLQAIEQARDAGERRKRGDNALQFAQIHFRMAETCNRMAALLGSAASKS